MDHVDFIMAYEAGEDLTMDEFLNGFQAMIDDGTCWKLQGCYGRTATALIDQGHCRPAGEVQNAS